jgi:hypothetical protein
MLPPGQPNGRYPGNELGEIRAFEYSNSWQTNSLGFRDRELVPKQPGEHRIGLVGDSMVAGHGVEQNERFMELWFAGIQDKPENATVWNLGTSGTGICDQASSIAQLADICALDEVILALFSGNELGDNEVWLANHERQKKMNRGDVKPPSSRRATVRRWLRENSRLATYLWVHHVQYLASKLSPKDEMNKLFARMWPTTEEGLDRFKQAVGDRPLTIWYLPDRTEWDDAHWKAVLASEGLQDEDRFAMHDAVVAWAQRSGVPVIDLTPVLRGHKRTEVKYRVDGHWNAGGHRLVAEALVKDPNASFLQRQLLSHDLSQKSGVERQTSP